MRIQEFSRWALVQASLFAEAFHEMLMCRNTVKILAGLQQALTKHEEKELNKQVRRTVLQHICHEEKELHKQVRMSVL